MSTRLLADSSGAGRITCRLPGPRLSLPLVASVRWSSCGVTASNATPETTATPLTTGGIHTVFSLSAKTLKNPVSSTFSGAT